MKTVTVKIAVAVDHNGHWYACGWPDGNEKEMMEVTLDSIDEGEARYWLTATLVVPEAVLVHATVEPEK